MRRRPLVLLCSPLLAVGLSACSAAVSTAAFKGEQHEVAQTVANLQSDATAGEEKKICANDLAGSVVARLGGASRCEAAIKSQLDQVDSLELSVRSVSLASNSKGGAKTASAEVKSIHSGKRRESTVSLVKEDGKWKISGLG
jgi:hypothetical protein